MTIAVLTYFFLLGSTDGQSSTSSPLSGPHTKDKSSSIDLEWEHEEGKYKTTLIIILCAKYLSMAHKQKDYNNIVCNVSLYGSQTKEFGIENKQSNFTYMPIKLKLMKCKTSHISVLFFSNPFSFICTMLKLPLYIDYNSKYTENDVVKLVYVLHIG